MVRQSSEKRKCKPVFTPIVPIERLGEHNTEHERNANEPTLDYAMLPHPYKSYKVYSVQLGFDILILNSSYNYTRDPFVSYEASNERRKTERHDHACKIS